MAESITITDNRTGESIEIPSSTAGCRPRSGPSCSPASGSTTPASCRRRPARAPSPTSTATPASCATAATRSSSWPRTRPTWRWPTSSSTASCPTRRSSTPGSHEITYHTFIHENVRKRFLEGFHYDAHPMGMLVSRSPRSRPSTSTPRTSSTPSPQQADHPAHRQDADPGRGRPPLQRGHALRLPGQLARLRRQLPLDDVEGGRARFEADPVLARPSTSCSSSTPTTSRTARPRPCGWSGRRTPTPTRPRAAAAAALYGPRHGGANEAVIRMLTEIGSIENVPAFVEWSRRATAVRLQGFGHRVYKSYDPRAKIIKRTADEVFEVTGKNPLLDIALKLEEIASATSTSPRAGSTRTSTSTRASSTRPWASRSRCSRCSSPSPAPPAGWPTGRRCSTRTRRSPVPASSTSDPSSDYSADRPAADSAVVSR